MELCVLQTCSHHFVRETSTTDSDSTCVSHQKGEVISGACKTDINREKDCDENNSMACASVVSEIVKMYIVF